MPRRVCRPLWKYQETRRSIDELQPFEWIWRVVQVLIDTGPLVAYLNRRDRWHSWAVEQMSSLVPPLVTYEPVISEAKFLIQQMAATHVGLFKN